MRAKKETYKIYVYPGYIYDFLGRFFKAPNPSPLLILLIVSYLPRNPKDIKVCIYPTLIVIHGGVTMIGGKR